MFFRLLSTLSFSFSHFFLLSIWLCLWTCATCEISSPYSSSSFCFLDGSLSLNPQIVRTQTSYIAKCSPSQLHYNHNRWNNKNNKAADFNLNVNGNSNERRVGQVSVRRTQKRLKNDSKEVP